MRPSLPTASITRGAVAARPRQSSQSSFSAPRAEPSGPPRARMPQRRHAERVAARPLEASPRGALEERLVRDRVAPAPWIRAQRLRHGAGVAQRGQLEREAVEIASDQRGRAGRVGVDRIEQRLHLERALFARAVAVEVHGRERHRLLRRARSARAPRSGRPRGARRARRRTSRRAARAARAAAAAARRARESRCRGSRRRCSAPPSARARRRRPGPARGTRRRRRRRSRAARPARARCGDCPCAPCPSPSR